MNKPSIPKCSACRWFLVLLALYSLSVGTLTIVSGLRTYAIMSLLGILLIGFVLCFHHPE
jgi:hypothetical protein